MIWTEAETNSLCPNSFSPMPNGKFHNFAIEIRQHDDDGDDKDEGDDIGPCEPVKYTKPIKRVRHVKYKTNSGGVKQIKDDIEYENKCDV